MKNAHILGSFQLVLSPKFLIMLKRSSNPAWLAPEFLNASDKESHASISDSTSQLPNSVSVV